MPQIRIYDKQGNTLASFAAAARNGGLGYIGNKQFVVANPDFVELMEIDGTGTNLLTQIDQYNGVVVQFRSAFMAHSGFKDREWPHGFDNDGPYIGVNTRDGNSGIYRNILRLYDPKSLTKMHEVDMGPVTDAGGIDSTGGQLYTFAQYAVGGGTNALVKVQLEGIVATYPRSWVVTNFMTDLCYDGHYIWALESANVVRYLQDARSPPTQIDSFATGATNPIGLATDGNNLYVMSRA